MWPCTRKASCECWPQVRGSLEVTHLVDPGQFTRIVHCDKQSDRMSLNSVELSTPNRPRKSACTNTQTLPLVLHGQRCTMSENMNRQQRGLDSQLLAARPVSEISVVLGDLAGWQHLPNNQHLVRQFPYL